MSAQSSVIITISQTLLRVGKVVDPSQPVEQLVEYDWNRESLPEILTQIKTAYQTQTVRIVLSEAFSYVLCLPNVIPNILERAAVEEQLQTLIPEILGKVVWDYKETGLHLNPKNQASEAVQVIAVDRSFLDDLSSAVRVTELEVEAMEPISISLARQTQELPEPHAILYVGQMPLRLIAYKGLVLSSQIMGTQLLGNHLGELFKYTQTHFGLTPTSILLAGDTSKIASDQLQTLPIPTQVYALDPMLGMTAKTDLSGKDEWVLNLSPLTKEMIETQITELPSTITTENAAAPTPLSFAAESSPSPAVASPHQNSLNILLHPDKAQPPTPLPVADSPSIAKRLIALGLTLGTAGLIVGGYLAWNWYTNRAQPAVTPSPTPVSQPTPAPTPTPFNKAEIKIQVLNGSGEKGVASAMTDVLKELGYEQIEADNADRFDYEQTEIQVKAGQAKLYQDLADELSKDYELAEEPEVLKADSEYDVVVVVGEK